MCVTVEVGEIHQEGRGEGRGEERGASHDGQNRKIGK